MFRIFKRMNKISNFSSSPSELFERHQKLIIYSNAGAGKSYFLHLATEDKSLQGKFKVFYINLRTLYNSIEIESIKAILDKYIEVIQDLLTHGYVDCTLKPLVIIEDLELMDATVKFEKEKILENKSSFKKFTKEEIVKYEALRELINKVVETPTINTVVTLQSYPRFSEYKILQTIETKEYLVNIVNPSWKDLKFTKKFALTHFTPNLDSYPEQNTTKIMENADYFFEFKKQNKKGKIYSKNLKEQLQQLTEPY